MLALGHYFCDFFRIAGTDQSLGMPFGIRCIGEIPGNDALVANQLHADELTALELQISFERMIDFSEEEWMRRTVFIGVCWLAACGPDPVPVILLCRDDLGSGDDTGSSGDTGDPDSGDEEDTDTGSEVDTGDTDTDSGAPVDDTAWDSGDTGAEPQDMVWAGRETYEYGFDALPDVISCHIEWETLGAQSASSCTDCEFAFDVVLTYDASGSEDDGSCSSWADDWEYTYGYVEDYMGQGGTLMLDYSGTFYAWANAEFDGERFVYWNGVTNDYYYSGTSYYYVTSTIYGYAELTAE